MMNSSHLAMMLCLVMAACGASSTRTPTLTNAPTPELTSTATNTPTVTPTIKPGWSAFQGKYIWLMYPDTWSSEVHADAARFLNIEHNFYEVNMNFTRAAVSDFRNAKTLEDIALLSKISLSFVPSH